MTHIAYLDCVGGLAGDMLLAALLDAGAPEDALQALPKRLGLTGISILSERVERQGIGALKVRVDSNGDDERRDYRRIRSLVERADLPTRVRERSLTAFARLAEAESRIHDARLEDVHFHELGSVDTLIDVIGAFTLLDELAVEHVTSSPMPFARGLIEAAHGVLPLPAPATLALLEGAPLVGVDIEAELVTPTGAVIAAIAVDDWGRLPPLTLERVGYGAGTKELPDRPNIVRVVLGVASSVPNGRVALLEANLDDFPAELVPDVAESCFAAGALDVWTVPVTMKKGRPAFIITALTRPERQDAVARVLLEGTSTLGVRVAQLDRYELEREERHIKLDGGTVRVKIGLLDGQIVNAAPEHDDCAALARKTRRSVQSVWAEALVRATRSL